MTAKLLIISNSSAVNKILDMSGIKKIINVYSTREEAKKATRKD